MNSGDELELHIKTENAAFEDPGCGHEVARILRDVADRIEAGAGADDYLPVRDFNGNKVGRAEIIEGDYDDDEEEDW